MDTQLNFLNEENTRLNAEIMDQKRELTMYENAKSEINKLRKTQTKLEDTKVGLEKDLRRAEEINARLNQQKDAKATTVLKSQTKDKELDECKQDLER